MERYIVLSINVFRQKLNNLQSLQFMYVQLSWKVLCVVQGRKIFIISDYRLTYSDKNRTTCNACNSCTCSYLARYCTWFTERKIFIISDYRLTYSDKNWTTCKASNSCIHAVVSRYCTWFKSLKISLGSSIANSPTTSFLWAEVAWEVHTFYLSVFLGGQK